ncbi:hypothetical protein [Arsenophonus endosymbiont of Aleurodicus floccissimus]|uniref:hypothetical protein n=1 Tax=Arsenophonus endosymbiont of Aleurodicus floccissimus TaxID=2152761 RepID=UPI001EDE82B2|nr:hypothetical protein [Arsenophonus endosymbiont of Aleurodicus floccissimus]
MHLFIGVLEWVRNLIVIRISTGLNLSVNQSVFNAAYQQSLKYSDSQASQALSDLTTLRQFVTGKALFALFDAGALVSLFPLCGVFTPSMVRLSSLRWRNFYFPINLAESTLHS